MEVEHEVGLTASDEESSAPLVRRSSKKKSVINFGENGSNRTAKSESENNRDSVADSESSIEEKEGNLALISKTEKEDNSSMIMIRDVGVTEKNLVENAEERLDGEEFEATKLEVTETSELTRLGETVNSKSETSVYFVEEEGSESIEILERGGTSLDYESEKTEFVKSEKVIQGMIEIKENHSEIREKEKNACLDTHVFCDTGSTVTVRNGDHTINKEEEKEENVGFKQHQHGNSVSESTRQNSHSSALNEQDEKQLRERWTTILEKSEFEGKVEAIVKILKEQESYDLVCPVCSSCITKRVILRKRKRMQKEATDDVQVNVSEGEHDITEIQNDQAEISNEDSEDFEAYGCLACFSLFFRRGVNFFARKSDSAQSRSGSSCLLEQCPPQVHQESTQFIDREKDSFHCLPFLYPWGQSNNKASSSRASSDFSVETSQQNSAKDADSNFKTKSLISISGMPDILQKNKAVAVNVSRLDGEKHALVDKVDLSKGGTHTNEENGATDDFTAGTSQVKHVKAAERIGKSSGSTLMNDGVKATTVAVVGLNEDKTSIKNGQIESQLNVGAVYSKHHVAVQEFSSTMTSQSTSSTSMTIQNKTFEASSTMNKNQMHTTPTENIIAEAEYTSTEAINNAVSVKGKSEFPHSVKEDRGLLDDEIRNAVGKNKVLNEVAPEKQLEKHHLYHEDVKGTEDQRAELHFNEKEKQLKMLPGEIDASIGEGGIRPQFGSQGQVLTSSSTALRDRELLTPEKEAENLKGMGPLRQGESYSKDNLCSCIPVSFPAVWSIWPTKKSSTDEQLNEPLLPSVGDETFDKVLPEALKDDREELISALKSGSAGSSCLETQDSTGLAQSKVDDCVPSVSDTFQNSEKKVLPSHAADETVIVVKETSDPQSSNSVTVATEPGNTGSQVQDSSVATEWDLLKSIVYGGLTVSITSLGVVSSAAGGDAKTLTVIVIGLANLVSGLFLLFNNILDLNYYHQQQFIETVGHSFWFNGFVAIFSFLVFGSLAPVTYGFSFQKSHDKLYKFLAASIVSLVSIILLSFGKARVTKKSYIRVMILYIVTGFWASFIGFFAGEYIKKLLEKWGIVTD